LSLMMATQTIEWMKKKITWNDGCCQSSSSAKTMTIWKTTSTGQLGTHRRWCPGIAP
jgi:hypothetical protein